MHTQPHTTNPLLTCGGDSMFDWRMDATHEVTTYSNMTAPIVIDLHTVECVMG